MTLAHSPAAHTHRETDGAVVVHPVYEFRPTDGEAQGTVLRYAEGAWIPDDGEWDVAFISYGAGAPLGLYIELPYQKNIIWSGLTSHWAANNPDHPRGNPWHYMLREGETEWGGDWGKDRHLNERAGRAAMNHCCSINSCANGRGPRFEIGNPHIALGLVRERDTKRIVRFPSELSCMFCGAGWAAALTAKEATTAPEAGAVGTTVGREPQKSTTREGADR